MESLRASFDVKVFPARSIAAPPDEPMLQTTRSREDHPFTGSMPRDPEMHPLDSSLRCLIFSQYQQITANRQAEWATLEINAVFFVHPDASSLFRRETLPENNLTFHNFSPVCVRPRPLSKG
jgi:hypothetical protein